MNRSESKYYNTACLMDEALLNLLEKKPLEYISVKEICEKAGVNRSTFYLHYETVGDLLSETLEYINKEFNESFGEDLKGFPERIKDARLEELVLIGPDILTPYLSFIKNHKNIFRAAVNDSSAMGVNSQLDGYREKIFKPIMDRFGIPSDEQEYRINYYIYGLTAIISVWIAGGCKDPIEYIENIIIKCVRPD